MYFGKIPESYYVVLVECLYGLYNKSVDCNRLEFTGICCDLFVVFMLHLFKQTILRCYCLVKIADL